MIASRIAGIVCRAQCALQNAPAATRQMTSARLARPATTATTTTTTMAGQRHTQLAQYRPFSVSATRATEAKKTAGQAAATSTESATRAATEATQASETQTTSPETQEKDKDDLPWYLRVDVPKHDTLTPQTTPLPDIPANAPPLVTPLVTFAADDLGLDDLKFIDLRGLDPPAGLGPDLVMLFATSRSERHLHVSADRLVRWFRTYGVNASADGLLGRNELKIKLKRKARRAKLLGNLGQMAGEEVDDGISTKWVCVNAGFIGGSKVDKKEDTKTDAKGRTTGFGSARSAGTTVVIQIFTEGKRKQMELEALWTKTLWHSLRKRRAAGEDVKDQLAALESEMKMSEDELERENDEWLAGLPSAEEVKSKSVSF